MKNLAMNSGFRNLEQQVFYGMYVLSFFLFPWLRWWFHSDFFPQCFKHDQTKLGNDETVVEEHIFQMGWGKPATT